MKILFTRHGETYDNLDHILTWQKDVELSPNGNEEAKKLSNKLCAFDIDIIYCSTLKRARDTVSPYLKHNNIKIVYTDSMKEMDLGKYNWTTEEEAKNERSKGLEHKVGWGESLYDLYNRADLFLKKIKKENIWKSVLLVWHNAINRNIIGIIKWYSIEEINTKKERYPNAEVLEFTI